MKITFDQLTNTNRDWLCANIMDSVPREVIDKVMSERFFEIKLVINGVEVDPRRLNDIHANVERYIEERAKELIKEKLYEADLHANELAEIVKKAKRKICDDYDIQDDDY